MQKALLFIPDISGFTEFVHHTDINHSRHIISELLEILIDENSMDLQLAEIEGDALFFYKLEDKINIDEIRAQIKRMYIAFHTHLKRYEYERICHCGACSSAYNLSLKFVTHYGDIEFIKVKETRKPYGSNVIQVHRLLKNEIPLSEYALFTEPLLPIDVINEKQNTARIISKYDFGEIEYSYNSLLYLKDKLPYVTPVPQEVPKHKLFEISESIASPILDLYEVISNFDYRLLWIKGIDKLEYEKNKVNRAGLKHKCLIAKNQIVDQTTVSKKADKGQLVYGESTQEAPLTKQLNIYYVLEEINKEETKLNIQAYVDFKWFGIFIKPILAKKLKNNMKENIKELILLLNSEFTIENQFKKNENA